MFKNRRLTSLTILRRRWHLTLFILCRIVYFYQHTFIFVFYFSLNFSILTFVIEFLSTFVLDLCHIGIIWHCIIKLNMQSHTPVYLMLIVQWEDEPWQQFCINVREPRGDNQEWTGYTRQDEDKQKKKHNTICVWHHYTQTNTNNANKPRALLQTTGGKDQPNIVSMRLLPRNIQILTLPFMSYKKQAGRYNKNSASQLVFVLVIGHSG